MAERAWNLVHDDRSPDTFRWVAVEFERRQDKGGHGYWHRVRRLAAPRVAKWAAEADGEASGLPLDPSAQHRHRALRLRDYVSGETEASARLGTRRCRPKDVADSLGLSRLYVRKLPRQAGAEATTSEDAAAAWDKKERKARERKRKREQLARARKQLKRVADAANAGAAGDVDKAARLRTGKSKATRKRASRKAARTRKRRAREFARRSEAAKRAWAKRRTQQRPESET